MITPLEKESLEVFRLVLMKMTGKPLGNMDFIEFMGHIRDIVRKLENKEYGCASGKHASTCQCQEAI